MDLINPSPFVPPSWVTQTTKTPITPKFGYPIHGPREPIPEKKNPLEKILNLLKNILK